MLFYSVANSGLVIAFRIFCLGMKFLQLNDFDYGIGKTAFLWQLLDK